MLLAGGRSTKSDWACAAEAHQSGSVKDVLPNLFRLVRFDNLLKREQVCKSSQAMLRQPHLPDIWCRKLSVRSGASSSGQQELTVACCFPYCSSTISNIQRFFCWLSWHWAGISHLGVHIDSGDWLLPEILALSRKDSCLPPIALHSGMPTAQIVLNGILLLFVPRHSWDMLLSCVHIVMCLIK